MSRKLALVTGSGLVLCAVFLGLAVLIGGDDIFHDARSLERVKPLVDLATHKAWQWNGGDTLALDAPINIRYRPSGPQAVLVTGPEELLRHVRVTDGRIASDTSMPRSSGKKLDAVISGVPIRKFVVNGTENLDLGEIDQPNLDLHINGTGVVRGRGKVGQLNLSISGPGNADLGALSVGDAKISILGSGDAVLSPHGSVRLVIAGSGNLRLLTRPAELRQTIIGSGHVDQLTGEAAKNALEISRIAVDTASGAIQATLGNDGIGRVAAQAAREGIESAHIDQQIREGVARGLSQSDLQNPGSGGVFIRGSNDTDLGQIQQKSLTITVSDSGSVTAAGKVDQLSVNILGSGDARLGKLAARTVKVQVMGSGSATIAPSQDLSALIMGSGDVHLMTRPTKIQRMILGSGHIIEERQIIEERRIIEEHR